MQEGMIMATIDNTVGPLSMLIISPNFTDDLGMKYRKVINSDLGHITVIYCKVCSTEETIPFL